MVEGFSEGVILETQSENVGGEGMGEGTEVQCICFWMCSLDHSSLQPGGPGSVIPHLQKWANPF